MVINKLLSQYFCVWDFSFYLYFNSSSEIIRDTGCFHHFFYIGDDEFFGIEQGVRQMVELQ